jgi:NAD kinase
MGLRRQDNKMEPDKIIIVKRHTPLEELLVRHSTTSQAKFYLESAGHSYESYEKAHNTYKEGLKGTLKAIPTRIRTQVLDKKDLSTFQFGDRDLVVVVGDDGLFVNVAKYLEKQQVISVNPDEERFDGVLASCNVQKFPETLNNVFRDKAKTENLTMAEAELDNGQILRALNDLFIGRKTHVSAKYTLTYQVAVEKQSSSGIIVSTGTGSTGWMTSVIGGAWAIANNRFMGGGKVPFSREDDYLLFAVREPFPTKITGANIVHGKLTKTIPLFIKSEMPSEGVIFGDGIESDYLEFNSGRTAVIQPSKNKISLVKKG